MRFPSNVSLLFCQEAEKNRERGCFYFQYHNHHNHYFYDFHTIFCVCLYVVAALMFTFVAYHFFVCIVFAVYELSLLPMSVFVCVLAIACFFLESIHVS